jgi:pseudaminic acid biosynthesis-associated methylase
MSKRFTTDQEEFWAGEFGDAYVDRNAGDALIGSNTALFSRILAKCAHIKSLIEFGANIGLNLRAIRALLPTLELDAIEINDKAVDQLQAWSGVRKIHHGSILEFHSDRTWDAALSKRVLIHINPECLPQVYASLFRANNRYILLVEYYNPTPVEVVYRGHAGKLFKRDFAGALLDRYIGLRIVDYGFVWRREPAFRQDDANWFLLEKIDACM